MVDAKLNAAICLGFFGLLLALASIIVTVILFVKVNNYIKTHPNSNSEDNKSTEEEKNNTQKTTQQPYNKPTIALNTWRKPEIICSALNTTYEHQFLETKISSETPKIAVCYSGQLRDFFKTRKNHIVFFKQLFPENAHIDYYMHLWDDKKISATDMMYVQNEMKDWDIRIDDMMDVQTNVLVMAGDRDGLTEEDSTAYIKRLSGMFKSIQLVNQQKVKQEVKTERKYDLVVRMRTDLLFTSWPKKSLQLHQDVNTYTCYIMYEKHTFEFAPYSVNDQFAFGDSASMNEYANTFPRLISMFREGCLANPECFLGYNLHKSLVDVRLTDFQFIFYRNLDKYKQALTQDILKTLN
jgi:hypothetical protein